MKKSAKKEQNYLDFIPVRSFSWHISTETNRVIIERPKFDNALLKKYVVPFFKKPVFEVKFDEIGSFVWQQIDGHNTIFEICKQLEAQFGDKVNPVHDRVSSFIKRLRQQRIVDYKK